MRALVQQRGLSRRELPGRLQCHPRHSVPGGALARHVCSPDIHPHHHPAGLPHRVLPHDQSDGVGGVDELSRHARRIPRTDRGDPVSRFQDIPHIRVLPLHRRHLLRAGQDHPRR